MKKNLLRYKKGFVLVVTLIATVFASALFVIIFINFYPLVGEYEKLENYDDIPSKYQAFWIRRMIESSDTSQQFKNTYNSFKLCSEQKARGLTCTYNNEFIDISKCESLFEPGTAQYNNCVNLYNTMNVKEAVITKYQTSGAKSKLIDNTNYSEEFRDYISYLPNYEIVKSQSSVESQYDYQYRVIVKFENKSKNEMNEDMTYYTYSTLEVK